MRNKHEIIVLIKPTIKQVNRIDRKYKNAKIFCFHEYLIKYTSKNSNNFESLILDSVLPTKYRHLLFENSKKIIQELMKSSDLINLFKYKDGNLFLYSRFHLLDKVIYKNLKTDLILKNIKYKYSNIKYIYISSDYYSIASLYFNTKKLFEYRKFDFLINTYTNIKNKVLPIVIIIYQLIYLPLFSFLVYQNKYKYLNIYDINILIGNINEFIHFKGKITNYLFKKDDKLLIFHPMRRYLLFKEMKKQLDHKFDFLSLDYFFRYKDILHILPKYTNYLSEFHNLINNISINNFNNDEFKSLFYEDMKYFFDYFYLVSLKYYTITHNLIDNIKPKGVITFAFAHTFYMNTMNNIFRKKGYITRTYNHGLIQSTTQMITETNENYSLSYFDLNLMKKYSEDDKYYHIKIPSKEIKIDSSFQKNLNLLILSRLYYPNAPYNITKNILNQIFSYIEFSKIKCNKIAIKPHPKEPMKLLKKFINYNYKDTNVISGNLMHILINYSFVITPFSTVILDCLHYGKPFMIFKTRFENSETFISKIPEELIFKNKFEFRKKFINLLTMNTMELDRLYEKIYAAYYWNK